MDREQLEELLVEFVKWVDGSSDFDIVKWKCDCEVDVVYPTAPTPKRLVREFMTATGRLTSGTGEGKQ